MYDETYNTAPENPTERLRHLEALRDWAWTTATANLEPVQIFADMDLPVVSYNFEIVVTKDGPKKGSTWYVNVYRNNIEQVELVQLIRSIPDGSYVKKLAYTYIVGTDTLHEDYSRIDKEFSPMNIPSSDRTAEICDQFIDSTVVVDEKQKGIIAKISARLGRKALGN